MSTRLKKILLRQEGFSLIEIMVTAGLMGLMAIGMTSLYKMGYSGVKSVTTTDESRSLTGDIAVTLAADPLVLGPPAGPNACSYTFGANATPAPINPTTTACGNTSVTAINDKSGAPLFQTVGALCPTCPGAPYTDPRCAPCRYGNNSLVLKTITVGGGTCNGSPKDALTNLQRFSSTGTNGSGFPTGVVLVLLDWRRVGDQMGSASVPRFFLVNAGLTGAGGTINDCKAVAGTAVAQFNGSGLTSYIPKWNGPQLLDTSSMYQDGNGNIGVGVAGSPAVPLPIAKLDVNGTGRINGALTVIGDVTLPTAGTSVTAHAFFYNSDRKLKTNIETITDPLEKVSQLRGVTFNWIKSGEKDIGFVAQEVEKILPEMVGTSHSEKDGDLKSVKYANIGAVVVEAVKELWNRLQAVMDRLAKLEQRNLNLAQENAGLRAQLQSETEIRKEENARLREAVCKFNPAARLCHSE